MQQLAYDIAKIMVEDKYRENKKTTQMKKIKLII